MARGVECDDLQCADPELLAISECLPVLPGEPRTVVYPGTGDPGEFNGAGNVVLVPVGLENLPDPDPLVLCDLLVDLAVSPGVDNKSLPLRRDQVTQGGKLSPISRFL